MTNTPTEAMVERAARAMWDAPPNPMYQAPWESLTDEGREYYRSIARAALATLPGVRVGEEHLWVIRRLLKRARTAQSILPCDSNAEEIAALAAVLAVWGEQDQHKENPCSSSGTTLTSTAGTTPVSPTPVRAEPEDVEREARRLTKEYIGNTCPNCERFAAWILTKLSQPPARQEGERSDFVGILPCRCGSQQGIAIRWSGGYKCEPREVRCLACTPHGQYVGVEAWNAKQKEPTCDPHERSGAGSRDAAVGGAAASPKMKSESGQPQTNPAPAAVGGSETEGGLDAHQREGIKRLSFHIPAMDMLSISQGAAIVRILERALAADAAWRAGGGGKGA